MDGKIFQRMDGNCKYSNLLTSSATDLHNRAEFGLQAVQIISFGLHVGHYLIFQSRRFPQSHRQPLTFTVTEKLSTQPRHPLQINSTHKNTSLQADQVIFLGFCSCKNYTSQVITTNMAEIRGQLKKIKSWHWP